MVLFKNENAKYGILNLKNTEYAGNPLILKQLEQEKHSEFELLAESNFLRVLIWDLQQYDDDPKWRR